MIYLLTLQMYNAYIASHTVLCPYKYNNILEPTIPSAHVLTMSLHCLQKHLCLMSIHLHRDW